MLKMKESLKRVIGVRLYRPLMVGVILVAGYGAVTLAASANAVYEAESGSMLGQVSSLGDGTASNGGYVQFNNTTSSAGQCGLAGQVFCEDFESGPVSNAPRNGDFDGKKFSVARFADNQKWVQPNWVGEGEIPAGCRNSADTTPLPPNDILVCNPNSSISSHYGYVATAVQNYGDNKVRINQPFDFAGRTGTIQFDAELDYVDGLLGGATMAISDQPYAAPQIHAENGNAGTPKNGFIIHFYNECNGDADPKASVLPTVRRYTNFVEEEIQNELVSGGFCPNGTTVHTAAGKLNRVQIKISATRIELWASEFSSNGTTYGSLKKIYGATTSVPLTRGWLTFGTHNHATHKYSGIGGQVGGAEIASENAAWDNIAFDGPALQAPHAFQAPDAMVASDAGVLLGYPFSSVAGSVMSPITISGVQNSGVTSAKLTFNAYIEGLGSTPIATRKVYYRLNGGTWREVSNDSALAAAYEGARFNYVVDVNPADLVNGNNTIQFAGDSGINYGYAPYVANVDLLTWQ